MRDLWLSLAVLAQNLLILSVCLVPVLLLACALLRGYAPAPLLRALLWRYRWTNLVFVALIAVSSGLGVGLLAQERGLRHGTAAAADKFDMVVAAPGSELTLMFAAVYLRPSDVPLLDGATYTRIAGHNRVALAAPLGFGDSWNGAPVVGTISAFADHLSDGRIQGRMWQSQNEGIAGALAPVRIGDSIRPAHGFGDAADTEAHDTHIHIVGRMGATGAPWDRAILVPIESVWDTHGLANGHAPERADQIGPPFDAEYFPGTPAIVVRATELWATYALQAEFTEPGQTMAFFPGAVLTSLYSVMGDVRQAMSILALVSQGLVAIAVLLALLILTRLFRRQMAVLRALGAPARFVAAIPWSYAMILLSAGALLGLLVGLGAAQALSAVVSARTDIAIQAFLGWTEIHLLAAFLALCAILALVPAYSVLRESLTEGLRS